MTYHNALLKLRCITKNYIVGEQNNPVKSEGGLWFREFFKDEVTF